MSSNPTSPTVPTNKRRSLRLSNFETTGDSLQQSQTAGMHSGQSYSPRSSRASLASFQQPSPTTAKPMSSRSSRQNSFHHRRKSSSRLSVGSSISIGQVDGGIGNLADELEDALENEYDAQDSSFLGGTREQDLYQSIESPQATHDTYGVPITGANSRTVDLPAGSGLLEPQNLTKTKLPKADKRKSRHQRTESRYDGSDYGPESDQEDEGFSPVLAKRIRDIESLTRMSTNTEDTLSEGGGVIKRAIHALKDLGPQSSIENNLSRIITAYTSMATHRTHKTRDLFSQAHSLLYGNILELSDETIDVLLHEIDDLAGTIPFLGQNPLVSLQVLASQTLDLAQTLQGLTDVLQESRISANTASRKLKSVRDMVEDLRIDEDLVEESMMLIQAGDWDRRCRERQAAATCREVIEGFGKKWGLEVEDRPWTAKSNIPVS